MAIPTQEQVYVDARLLGVANADDAADQSSYWLRQFNVHRSMGDDKYAIVCLEKAIKYANLNLWMTF